MREKHVDYLKDLPINIRLGNIKECPIGWQDSIAIFFVLRGSIRLGIETGVYPIGERQIEIVNTNESYWIKSDDGDNLVLIINIDPNFFARYYNDAKEVFFYTDSSNQEVQESQEYQVLRQQLSILLFEVIYKIDDYEDMVKENLLEMMYHLLNNFHYLYYEGENLEEDEVQLERYHRIVKYLSNNYMDKVSLQEIAEKEFLSSQYLSYKIKETFGLGFNEYLNQIRVEESTKLLLNTDKSISDISYEVGFSHLRYYNKHFKIHYKMTPSQYRKKHKLSSEELKSITKINYLPLEESLPYVKEYLEDYERYNYDNKIGKLDFNLGQEAIGIYEKPNLLDLGDISLLLEEENRRVLEEVQREIDFKYVLVNKLFSTNMDIYKGKNNRFINWTRVENILDFLLGLKLFPLIDGEGVENHILGDFKDNFSTIYGQEVEKWLDFNLDDLEGEIIKEDIDPSFDTMDMVPYIIHNYTNCQRRLVFNLVDEISKDTYLDNDTFFGGKGIYTNNYLNKPSYYALMLLSLLGEEVLYRDEGYIVTKSQEGYQVLIYNLGQLEAAEGQEPDTSPKEKKVSINLSNMEEDFQITKYDLNKNFGSSYDKWLHMGSPERIDNKHWQLLKEFVHPNISFYYGKKSIILNLRARVKPKGAVLFILNKVENE